MAKIVRTYKTFTIKETTRFDNTDYKYWVFTKSNKYDVEWEADNLQECLDFIDSFNPFFQKN
jgi:hypothetical protein